MASADDMAPDTAPLPFLPRTVRLAPVRASRKGGGGSE